MLITASSSSVANSASHVTYTSLRAFGATSCSSKDFQLTIVGNWFRLQHSCSHSFTQNDILQVFVYHNASHGASNAMKYNEDAFNRVSPAVIHQITTSILRQYRTSSQLLIHRMSPMRDDPCSSST